MPLTEQANASIRVGVVPDADVGTLHRRQLLIGAAATLCLDATGAMAAPPSEQFIPIRRVARERGLDFGFAIDPRRLAAEPGYASFVAQQATIVVPENVLKWTIVHPEPDRYDFAPADQIASFAQAHDIAMRGHTFCWHRALPDWVTRTVTRKNAEAVLTEHIQTVAGHYKGAIRSWDVLNEVLNPSDGLPGGWRNSFWYQVLGPAYADIALHAAHRTDPTAVLCYNDYGLGAQGNYGAARRAAALDMLRGFQRRRTPIGALGIQSHLRGDEPNSFGPELARFILDVHSLGFAVYITEMDVDDSKLDPAMSDGIVASVYKRYLDLVLGTSAVSTVLTWGVWDVPHFTGANPGQTGPMARRPLLFAPGGAIKDASWAAEHSFERARPVSARP